MNWFNVAAPVFDTVSATDPDDAVRVLSKELEAHGFEVYRSGIDHQPTAIATIRAGEFDVVVHVVQVVAAQNAGVAVERLIRQLVDQKFNADGPGDAFLSDCDPYGNPA